MKYEPSTDTFVEFNTNDSAFQITVALDAQPYVVTRQGDLFKR